MNDAAEADLRAALAQDPDDRAAERALSRLLEDAGRHEDLALHLLERLEVVVGPDRLPLFERVADVLEEHLDAPERALRVLVQAFSETGDDDRLGRTLARLAQRTGQWDAVFEVYEQRLLQPGLREPIDLHRRLAGWYQVQGRGADAARHLWRVLKSDPDDAGAAHDLEAHYEAVEDWRALVDLLRSRLARVTDDEAHKRATQRIARLLEVRLGAAAEAIAVVGELYQRAPDEGLEEALERLAEASGEWAALARVYEAALQATVAVPRDLAQVHRRLGRLYSRRLGDVERAVRHYDRALEADPDDVRTLGELRGLLEAEQRWGELAMVLAQEARLVGDRAERYRRYLALGELYHDRIGSAADAAEAWFQALEARPDDKAVLVRLLEVYGESGQWDAAVKVLRRLVKVEADIARRAQFELTMGVVLRDELGDRYQAVRAFDRALELRPTFAEAFEAMEATLAEEGDPARRDRYYRKMLQRAREHRLDARLIEKLARALVALNRDELGQPAAALQAMKVVLKYAPDDTTARLQMAQLAEEAGRSDDAAEILRGLLERDPSNVEAWHALYRVYRSVRRYDAAWCVSQALMLVGQARDDESRFYRKGRAAQDERTVGALRPPDWLAVRAPGKSEALDALYLNLNATAWPLMTGDPRDLKLSPKRDRVTLDLGTRFGQVAAYVGRIVGLQLDAVWATERASGISIPNLDPPALLVGPDVEQLPLEALAFMLSRWLYLMARQHVAAAVDEEPGRRRARLVALAATGLARVFPQSAPPGYDAGLLQALGGLPGGAVGAIERAGAPLLDPGLEAFGVDAWLEALEHSANRVGFVVCNDLAAAVGRIQAEARPVAPASVNDRVRALLLFSVSPAYLEVRQRLGLSLDT